MTNPTEISKRGFTFEFADRTMGRKRQGKGTFMAPYKISYEAVFAANDNDDDNKKQQQQEEQAKVFNLTAYMTPTKPGWSRIILLGAQQNPEKRQKESLLAKIFRKLPAWIIHTLNNRFLDSDLYFLHYQEHERRARENPNAVNNTSYYFMPTQADRCVSALRRWVQQYAPSVLSMSTTLPVIADRTILFDRWEQHGQHCRHCTRAKQRLQEWKTYSRRVLYAGILLSFKFKLAARLGVILSLVVWNRLTALEQALVTGGFNHYENH